MAPCADELAIPVGAGVSVRSTGSTQWTWKSGLAAGVKEGQMLGTIGRPRDDLMMQARECPHVDDYLSVGEKVTNALGGHGSGDFAACRCHCLRRLRTCGRGRGD